MTDGKKTSRSLLVIADCIFERDMIEVFKRKHGVDEVMIFEKSLGRYTGFRIFYRHINYLLLAFRGYIFWRFKKVELVLIWQQYIGLYFSLISILDITRLFSNFSSRVMLFYIIPKRKILSGLFLGLYDAGAIGRIVYFSVAEFNGSASRKKLLFHYWQKPLDEQHIKLIRDRVIEDGRYIFSGGTSNRNYGDIAYLAGIFKDTKFTVACTARDASDVDFPPNVRVYHDKYEDDFSSLLCHARFVVLPLKNPSVAGGQIVLLRALEFRKPVIINCDQGSLEKWLKSDGKKGVLLYRTKEELLRLAGRLMSDENFYNENTAAAAEISGGESRYRQWAEDLADLYFVKT